MNINEPILCHSDNGFITFYKYGTEDRFISSIKCAFNIEREDFQNLVYIKRVDLDLYGHSCALFFDQDGSAWLEIGSESIQEAAAEALDKNASFRKLD